MSIALSSEGFERFGNNLLFKRPLASSLKLFYIPSLFLISNVFLYNSLLRSFNEDSHDDEIPPPSELCVIYNSAPCSPYTWPTSHVHSNNSYFSSTFLRSNLKIVNKYLSVLYSSLTKVDCPSTSISTSSSSAVPPPSSLIIIYSNTTQFPPPPSPPSFLSIHFKEFNKRYVSPLLHNNQSTTSSQPLPRSLSTTVKSPARKSVPNHTTSLSRSIVAKDDVEKIFFLPQKIKKAFFLSLSFSDPLEFSTQGVFDDASNIRSLSSVLKSCFAFPKPFISEERKSFACRSYKCKHFLYDPFPDKFFMQRRMIHTKTSKMHLTSTASLFNLQHRMLDDDHRPSQCHSPLPCSDCLSSQGKEKMYKVTDGNIHSKPVLSTTIGELPQDNDNGKSLPGHSDPIPCSNHTAEDEAIKKIESTVSITSPSTALHMEGDVKSHSTPFVKSSFELKDIEDEGAGHRSHTATTDSLPTRPFNTSSIVDNIIQYQTLSGHNDPNHEDELNITSRGQGSMSEIYDIDTINSSNIDDSNISNSNSHTGDVDESNGAIDIDFLDPVRQHQVEQMNIIIREVRNGTIHSLEEYNVCLDKASVFQVDSVLWIYKQMTQRDSIIPDRRTMEIMFYSCLESKCLAQALSLLESFTRFDLRIRPLCFKIAVSLSVFHRDWNSAKFILRSMEYQEQKYGMNFSPNLYFNLMDVLLDGGISQRDESFSLYSKVVRLKGDAGLSRRKLIRLIDLFTLHPTPSAVGLRLMERDKRRSSGNFNARVLDHGHYNFCIALFIFERALKSSSFAYVHPGLTPSIILAYGTQLVRKHYEENNEKIIEDKENISADKSGNELTDLKYQSLLSGPERNDKDNQDKSGNAGLGIQDKPRDTEEADISNYFNIVKNFLRALKHGGDPNYLYLQQNNVALAGSDVLKFNMDKSVDIDNQNDIGKTGEDHTNDEYRVKNDSKVKIETRPGQVYHMTKLERFFHNCTVVDQHTETFHARHETLPSISNVWKKSASVPDAAFYLFPPILISFLLRNNMNQTEHVFTEEICSIIEDFFSSFVAKDQHSEVWNYLSTYSMRICVLHKLETLDVTKQLSFFESLTKNTLMS